MASGKGEGSRETSFSELGGQAHLPRAFRGLSIGQMRDTTSRVGKTIEYMEDCQKVIKVFDELDKEVIKGRDNFQAYLLENKDRLQETINGLIKDKPFVLEFFNNAVQQKSDKDPSWEPLLKLTEK